MEGHDLRFRFPSNMLVVGPTSSGKTTWLKNLVEHRYNFFSSKPEALLLFHKEPQAAYSAIEKDMVEDKKPNISFPSFCSFKTVPKSIEEMKEILDTYPRKSPKIIVFDDYLDEVGHVLKHMFTVLTHHYNCFTIFLCQNLFDAKSDLRTLSINAQYMVLFNNPRDRSAVSNLAKQIFPGHVGILKKAYQEAVANRHYGYLLLDFHQQQDDRVRMRSHIFPHEGFTKTYMPL